MPVEHNLREHIVNLMTLRYDPLDQPLIRLRNWHDFLPYEGYDHKDRLLKLVRNKLEEKIVNEEHHRVGIALSGGVDSTFVLSQLREISPEVEVYAFCANFGDVYDETEVARQVAKFFNSKFIGFKINNPFIKLKDLIKITEEPRWNLYFYYVLEEASKYCELILTGDGGDELFGGYTFRYSKFLSNLKPKDGWREKIINYLNCHERDWVPDQENLFGKSVNFSWERIYGLFVKYFNNPLDPLDQVFLADFNGKLAFDWIPTNKKLSEHLDMECYTPFLNEDVINLATHIPNIYKYDRKSNLGKKILRSCIECFGLPINNQKLGFGMDLITMWERVGKTWFERYMSSGLIAVEKDIINKEWLKQAYVKANIEKSPRYINKLFSILSLEIWLREFGSRL